MRNELIEFIVQKLLENKATDDFYSLKDCCYRYNPAEVARILEDLGWTEDVDSSVAEGYNYFQFFDKDGETIVLYFCAIDFDLELQNFIAPTAL